MGGGGGAGRRSEVQLMQSTAIPLDALNRPTWPYLVRSQHDWPLAAPTLPLSPPGPARRRTGTGCEAPVWLAASCEEPTATRQAVIALGVCACSVLCLNVWFPVWRALEVDAHDTPRASAPGDCCLDVGRGWSDSFHLHTHRPPGHASTIHKPSLSVSNIQQEPSRSPVKEVLHIALCEEGKVGIPGVRGGGGD